MSLLSLPVIKKASSFIVYSGPSMLDGKPIIVVLTNLGSASENEKTGDMVQSYILCADQSPIQAIESGADESICGDCIHRKHDGAGTCYVNVGQGPSSIYQAYKRGSYQVVEPSTIAHLLQGRILRLGSYGDPVAVPLYVWIPLIEASIGHTGYTHQWRKAIARPYRRYVMASCETAAQSWTARRKGWRTFRVKLANQERIKGEIVCPASQEAGKRLACDECQACNGAMDNAGRASVVIDAHGLDWKVKRYEKVQNALSKKQRFRILDSK